VSPFLRARADYTKVKLLKIIYILPTEERKRNKIKGGEMNWLVAELKTVTENLISLL
jgi:hypothetical protein